MIEYKSDLTVIKRLVENSEQKLFPRMKKRKEYLDSLTKENNEIPLALKAESELNDLIRQHVQLVMNYAIYMEKVIEKNLQSDFIQSDYEKVLEQELLYEFRKKHNIVK